MVNIVVAYSQQRGNRCIMGDTEHDHMYSIAKALYDDLSNRFNTYLIPPQNLGSDNANLKESIRLSNAFISKYGGGYHIELHSDGGYDGSGASAFYYSESGRKFITPIYEAMSRLTPWKDMAIKERRNLLALRGTKAISGLLEVSFHDKPNEAKWIHDNIHTIAKTISKAIYGYFGIEYASEPVDVREFQRMTGLAVDGIIGQQTRQKAEEIKAVCDYILNYQKETKVEFDRQGITDIVFVDPLAVKFAKVSASKSSVLSRYKTFIAGMQYGSKDGKMLTIGTGYSEGKKITQRLDWDNVPRGTLIVHKDGRVTVEQLIDPDKKYSDIWFCVQNAGLNPINLKAEWWPDSVGRATNRLMIGYNPEINKVIWTLRPDTDMERGKKTLINLGCVKDGKVLGITLDSGSMATMVQNDKVIMCPNYLDNIIYV